LSVLVEDSLRAHRPDWICDAVGQGIAAGAVLGPWATPLASQPGPGGKPGIAACVSELRTAGVDVWFDPSTHGLQASNAGDFGYYDEYDLWSGPRGELTEDALREKHVGKVFELQDTLGVPHLAPTVLLPAGLNRTSALALDLARKAVRRDPRCRLSIAGTTAFWAGRRKLDAHIGALAALQPGGWFLTVVQDEASLPAPAEPDEIHGLCRATRALSEYAPVHISHGDLAALPAVAAGATTVGSGWEKHQRVCSCKNYEASDPNTKSDGRYSGLTLRGLLGCLLPNDATLLNWSDPKFVEGLGGLPPSGRRKSFDHHLTVLSAVIAELKAIEEPAARYHHLVRLYRSAWAKWPQVRRYTGCRKAERQWIAGPGNGLLLYGATEGWSENA
jgi:hypothetical protein